MINWACRKADKTTPPPPSPEVVICSTKQPRFINTSLKLKDANTEQDHFAEVQFVLRDFLFSKEIKEDFRAIGEARTAEEMLAKRLDAYKYRTENL